MPETASEALDMLHDIERAALPITDIEQKKEYYQEVVDPSYLEPVVEHYLSIASQQVFTRNPNKGKSWTGRLNDRKFFAFVANCSYRYYESLGINGLVFAFVEPSLVEVQPQHKATLKKLQFIAPVLGVTAFHNADFLAVEA
ncbi:MAG TPA: hypothetical protein VN778_01025 [Verrucomicrobiae bacterium]|nr:hypothetical protein [Verrucomicrobiae bacterium]